MNIIPIATLYNNKTISATAITPTTNKHSEILNWIAIVFMMMIVIIIRLI